MAMTDKKRSGSKAADGRGSIRPWRGIWRGRVMVGFRPDGRPDVRCVYAKTQKGCQDKLDDVRARAKGGLLSDADKERETVAGFLTRWVDATRVAVRPKTHKRYEEIVKLHLIPGLGRYKLSALRPDDVRRFYAHKLTATNRKAAKTLSARTVHHCHRVLHRALEMAVADGYIPRNVAHIAGGPKVPRREIIPPTPEQVVALLESAEARGDRLAALWTTAPYSGFRLGELLGLQWEDVDLDQGTLIIRRTVVKTRRGVPKFGEPKSNSSRRTLKLDEDAILALRAHRDRQNFERQRLGEAYAPFNLVFATALGTAYASSEISHRFKDALERAGLPRAIRFHDLRHANGTAMLAGGVHPKVASARLGHSTIGITMDLYTHTVKELDADAARKIGDVFRRARKRTI